ncbi:class I SAM-dependent methyltransferase [Altericroceibacterium xinjiangense]|uniref:class I SAM-dependent methyltransferase n=1 Tax=Altericroceibacterium xinjiangense TaxID=762261 RepID=UPI000F7E4F2A|nr:class I SAM-dependent methyltransferase [Altericroceibacterium xinjiangense]
MGSGAIIAAYEQAATPARIAAWEGIDSNTLLMPILSFLPPNGARLLDVGAGTGRDAAWLAAKGHRITAVEPAAALRKAGERLHARTGIEWIDDRLPQLPSLEQRRFDAILSVAVWQHLDRNGRAEATTRLAHLLEPDGVLLLSLRHGPGASDRPVFPCDPLETIGDAARTGLRLLKRTEAESLQPGNRATGVSRTWLAFART